MKKFFKKQTSLFLAALLVLSTYQIPAFAEGFNDIAGHYAQDAINNLSSAKIIAGYSDGTFKPNELVTRAEYVALLNRLFKLEKKADISFSDVSENMWSYQDIKIAVARGYVSGYSDKTFRPDNPITRAEVCIMLSRLIKDGQNMMNDIKLDFKDQIPSWAKNSINLVVSKGYMSGYPDGSFGADKFITRGEVSSCLYRVQNDIKNAENRPNITNSIPEKNQMDELKKEDVKVEKKGDKKKAASTSGSGGGRRRGSTTAIKNDEYKKVEDTIKNLPQINSSQDAKNKKEDIKKAAQSYNKLPLSQRGKISSSQKAKLESAILKLSEIIPDPASGIKIVANKTDNEAYKTKSANVTSSANIDDFVGVKSTVNGQDKILDESIDYKAISGSTKIILSSDFIDGYTDNTDIYITIISTTGSVTTRITIKDNFSDKYKNERNALEQVIRIAIEKADNYVVSDSASDVDQKVNYVTHEQKDSLKKAISKAKVEYNNKDANRKSLEKAKSDLEKAITTFENLAKNQKGTKVDVDAEKTRLRKELKTLLEKGEAYLKDIQVGVSADKVAEGVKFVKPIDKNNLDDAMGNAAQPYNSISAKLEDLKVAIKELSDAIKTFEEAIQIGTYRETTEEKEKRLAKEALQEFIEQIGTYIRDIKTSEDGENVERDKHYATTVQLERITDAIGNAKNVLRNGQTKSDFEQGKNILQRAYETFKEAIKNQVGKKLTAEEQQIKDQIQADVENLENIVKNIAKVSEDGKDIEYTQVWITQDLKDEILQGIEKVKNTINNPAITKSELEKASQDQKDLMQKYQQNAKSGLKN